MQVGVWLVVEQSLVVAACLGGAGRPLHGNGKWNLEFVSLISINSIVEVNWCVVSVDNGVDCEFKKLIALSFETIDW